MDNSSLDIVFVFQGGKPFQTGNKIHCWVYATLIPFNRTTDLASYQLYISVEGSHNADELPQYNWEIGTLDATSYHNASWTHYGYANLTFDIQGLHSVEIDVWKQRIGFIDRYNMENIVPIMDSWDFTMNTFEAAALAVGLVSLIFVVFIEIAKYTNVEDDLKKGKKPD